MEYAKALTEVDEILKHLSEEDYRKIPEDIINIIKQYMDKNYNWKYDETKKLRDQDMRKDTIAFLSYINMEYLVNDGQREFLERLHEINEEKQNKNEKDRDIQQTIRYNTIKNFEEENIKTEESEQLRELVVVKESIFRKIFNKMKKIFRRKERINVKQQMKQNQEQRKNNIVIPQVKSNFYENLKNGNKTINLLKKLQTQQIKVDDLNENELDEMINIYNQQIADKERMIKKLKNN